MTQEALLTDAVENRQVVEEVLQALAVKAARGVDLAEGKAVGPTEAKAVQAEIKAATDRGMVITFEHNMIAENH